MTTRERKLAVILLVILLGAGGLLVAKVFYFDPADGLGKQLRSRKDELKQRQAEVEAEKKQTAGILALSPRLAQWKKLSLPQPASDSPDAIRTHNALLSGAYQKFL